MRDPRSSRSWKRLRATWAAAIATGRVDCWRCGQRIDAGQPWDLGHRVAVRLGGSDEHVHPEHRRCSRSAGGELSVEVRRNGGHVYPPPSREW
jgi:hypothetical protein